MTDPVGDWRPVVPKDREANAHTPNDAGDWHSFSDHARAVASLAAEFASDFGGAEAARLAGLIHDAGKLTVEAQDALVRCARGLQKKLGVQHKQEGCGIAFSVLPDQLGALVVAMVVYGHHHRLPWLGGEPRAQMLRAQNWPTSLALVAERLAAELDGEFEDAVGRFCLPSRLNPDGFGDVELFIRMVHSAVVDADFLDTSAHFDGKAAPSLSKPRGMVMLWDYFYRWYVQRFGAEPVTGVNQIRRHVFDQSVKVATDADLAESHGIYRLPAPTGSGKTMAAAAFALSHAAAFRKRRVIVAIPFTSITTQNAAEYRKAFEGLGPDVVLEHHSNILDDEVGEDTWRRLSAENWDAEFIVTTTVQLFESLFSGRPAASRKLHRIANSVIVLDEIQALPTGLLTSILGVLRRLARDYGVTVLLASATQPSFWRLEVWEDLPCIDVLPLNAVPEMNRRVRWEVRSSPITWERFADEVASERQAMVIVNTTADAQNLHSLITDSGVTTRVLHLSTRMFPLHRAEVLAETRKLLEIAEPVILVSTQLIEAGVDVDFPVVFRALAPAESLIQSAGRCNREGRLSEGGKVVVFEPVDGGVPQGTYSMATEIARNLFVDRGCALDNPADLDFYYRQLYATALSGVSASDEIKEAQKKLDFPRVAELFQMIDEVTVAVVVADQGPAEPRAALSRLLARLEVDPGAVLYRADRQLLQRFAASLPRRLVTSSLVVDRSPSGLLIWRGDYDPFRGVVVESGGAVW